MSADGIALSMDGGTLYWQALTGRTLYRVDTAALMDDDPEDAGKKVEKVGTTCVADGLLMSRDEHPLHHLARGQRGEGVEGDRSGP